MFDIATREAAQGSETARGANQFTNRSRLNRLEARSISLAFVKRIISRVESERLGDNRVH